MTTIERTTQPSCDNCGWVGALTSPSLAARSQRIHKCEKHLAAAASRARGEARRANVDRTPKPCWHKQADHQHGHYATYKLDLCRCQPCCTANTLYHRAHERQKAYGRYDKYVDADLVRDHIRTLNEAGIGRHQIELLGQVSAGSMNKLIYGSPRADGTRRPPAARILKTTANRILEIEPLPDNIAAGNRVDSTGTIRRLQALVAIGWSQSELARRLGLLPSNFCIGTMTRPLCLASTARAVVDLYEQLWNTRPAESDHRSRISASRARRHAADRGWKAPLAWDDDTIDSPVSPDVEQLDPSLDEIAIERAMAGDPPANLRKLEREEAVRRLRLLGFSVRETADRLGLHPRQINRDRAA